MLETIRRGVMRKGVVTSRYPEQGYRPHEGHIGMPVLDPARCSLHGICASACPVQAIRPRDGGMEVDLGACILCGECVRACPEGAWRMSAEFELASLSREGLLRPSPPQARSVDELGRTLDAKIRKAFGRSLAVREVDAGSCNACEVEVNALTNAVHDIERFGLHIVASPRHADVLLVTGPVTRNMEHALMQTFNATPDPKLVMAMGACACSGGIFKEGYASAGGVDKVLPVDVYIPGCPPRPEAIIHAFLVAVGKLEDRRR